MRIGCTLSTESWVQCDNDLVIKQPVFTQPRSIFVPDEDGQFLTTTSPVSTLQEVGALSVGSIVEGFGAAHVASSSSETGKPPPTRRPSSESSVRAGPLKEPNVLTAKTTRRMPRGSGPHPARGQRAARSGAHSLALGRRRGGGGRVNGADLQPANAIA
mgnify:CR=1 FL=1